MKIFKNFNIVALGSWNRKIFTPQWIMTNVMNLGPDEKLEGAFNSEEIELNYKVKDIIISPKESSLEISALADNIETRKLVLSTLSQILKLLPYTPLKGVGFNFVYAIELEDLPFLEAQMKSSDLLPEGLEIFKLTYREKDPKFILNIIVEKKTDEWQLTFNFHHPMVITFDEDYLNKLNSYIDKYFAK